jgi:hypothetical protein
MQETYRGKIKDFEGVVATAQMMLRVAEILKIPVIASEQNPNRLGRTVAEVAKYLPSSHCKLFSKFTFSMINEESQKMLDIYHSLKTAVVFGLETHLCVQQTCEDLL